ncbi:MAG: MaoC family dehydratase N-terminal domain-containing protein [Chloroflexi bacterium]|nr:MaoC family dehydratase N-terminal domain-containing protein [Chloroflexota bacterium]
MTTDEGINYDRSYLDKEFPIGTFEISREMILEFSQASGEVNPIYVDEAQAAESEYGDIIAPPTFCNLFVNGGEKPDIKLEFGDIGFFAGQAIESIAPIRPGDTVEVTSRLKEVYAKTGRSGTMVFAVWETKFDNQDGETVALVDESYVRRNSRRAS